MSELPTQGDFEDFAAWQGREVHGGDGVLGRVDAIFLDEATDRPEWVLVKLDGEQSPAFVPLAGATVESTIIRVEADRERAGAAPRLGEGDTLSVAEERRLYEHYGLAYSEQESPTVLPEESATPETPAVEEREAHEEHEEHSPKVVSGPDAPPTPAPASAKPRLRRFVDVPQPPSPAAPAEAWAAAEKDGAGSLLSRVPIPAVIGVSAAALGALVFIVLRRRSS